MGGSGPCPIDGTLPDLHERSLVPTVTFPWAGDPVGGYPRPGERVFNVALGTGIAARLVAERVSGGRDGSRGADRPAFRDRRPRPRLFPTLHGFRIVPRR